MILIPYAYAKQNINSFDKIASNNGPLTSKPTYKYEKYSERYYFTEEPTEEPTEKLITTPFPTKYIKPELPVEVSVKNFTCICEYNNENAKLIIAASVSSTLCFILFVTLIWYRFIFKKKLLKWQTNESNFGFGP